MIKHIIISAFGITGIAFAVFSFSGPPLLTSLDNFILFAQEEIKLEKGVQVSSGDLGSNGKIDIEKDSVINGNLFADKINVDKNSTINGNVSFNKLKTEKETQILGTQTKPAQLPIANLPDIPEFPIGTQDFKFEGKGNTLPTGNYHDIVLEKGSRLTLVGGVYNLRKLELKDGAVLIFTALTTLNIRHELKGQEHIAILPGQSLKPQDLVINYQGQNDKDEPDQKDKDQNQDKKEAQDTKPVEFGKNSFLNFKLLAPKASVHIEKESTLRGQVLARKIKIEKDSVVSREATTIKIAKPEDIVTDPNGGVYPINEILVSLVPEATAVDAENIAASINGRIVGVVSSINLYQIEVPTRTIQGLENIITTLRSRPKVDGVFRDFQALDRTTQQDKFQEIVGVRKEAAIRLLLPVLLVILLVYLVIYKSFGIVHNKRQMIIFGSALAIFSATPLINIHSLNVGYDFGYPFRIFSMSIPGRPVWFNLFGLLGDAVFAHLFSLGVEAFLQNLRTFTTKNKRTILQLIILIFILILGTFIFLSRYVLMHLPASGPGIIFGINSAHAQTNIKYDLQNLRNRDANLVRAYDLIKVQKAWDALKDSAVSLSSVSVGVVDTGIDASHPEFHNPDVNILAPANALFDSHAGGHGTQVAGIIAANNVSATTQLPADSPQLNGILSGALSENKYTLINESYGSATASRPSAIFVALENLLKKNPAIVNMSFGFEKCTDLPFIPGTIQRITDKCVTTSQEFDDMDRKFRGILENHADALFVASAGNENVDNSLSIPSRHSAFLSNVVAVGATDLDDKRADFLLGFKSNFGSSVNISAPGKNVYAPKPGNDYDKPQEISGVITGGFSGTSASAPMVTGVAGLLKAIKPELTPAQIKQILIETGNPIHTDKPIGPRLNAGKAVCHHLVLNCIAVADQWVTKSMMPTARYLLTSAVVNGKIYVIGGQAGPIVGTVEEYDPATDSWRTRNPMPTPRAILTSSVVNGRIFTFGGDTTPGQISRTDIVEAYDPATDTWMTKSSMPTKRSWANAASVNGKIYVIGGADANGSPLI